MGLLDADVEAAAELAARFAEIDRSRAEKASGTTLGKAPWCNADRFVSEGYVARIVRYSCKCCHKTADHPLGVFHAERNTSSGMRRLQALPPNGQWPLESGLAYEVETAEIPHCADCLWQLGFDREVPASGVYTRILPN